MHQARLAADPAQRLAVIRRMCTVRFEQVVRIQLSLEQIRGLEGQRCARPTPRPKL
ncbi:MAG: hypothetical protein M5R40_06700 [Anaerolineae bacterium]|nr:hypothetical protein [Anaerolineae bacterium]